MAMNEKITSSQICRGCMKVGGLFLSMYGDAMDDKKLPDKLASLASITISEHDGLPDVLCPKCAYRTDIFYEFKLQVQESEKRLRKMFTKSLIDDSTTNTLCNELTEEKFIDNDSQSKYYGDTDPAGHCIDNHLNDVLIDMNYSSDRVGDSLDDGMAMEQFGEDNNDIINAQNDRFLTASPSEFNSLKPESIDIVSNEISNKCNQEINSPAIEYMFLYVSPDNNEIILKNETIDNESCQTDVKFEPKKIEIDSVEGTVHDYSEIDLENTIIDKRSSQTGRNFMLKKIKKREVGKWHDKSGIDFKNGEMGEQTSPNNKSPKTKKEIIKEDKNLCVNDENDKDTDVRNEISDCDSDDYIDPKDNLLGSLNDTIVRIKEIKLDNGSVQHQCTLCMQNYSELTGILIHTVDNHIPSTGPFYCVVCEKDCDSHKELRAHVKTHIGPTPYTCFICEKGYSTKRYLKRHITCHTDFPRHRCFKCGERFKIKNELEDHIKTHSQGAPYTCSQCSRTFNHKPNYRRHLISHLDPRGVRLPKFPCCICGKRFLNNRTLKTHMRVHTGEKPFKCDICGRTFTQQGNLINHSKIHLNPRSFTCEVCGKRFNQRATLRDHTLLHTGEKPFICTVCGVAFTVGAALRRHMWKHADDKPFGCDRCKARFVGKYDLNRHMKTHTTKCKIRWQKDAFINKDNEHDSDNDPDSNDIIIPMVSPNQVHEQDNMVVTQVTPVSEQTIFIEHVLADQDGIQMIVPQGESEKENVDALFNLIQY